MQAEKIENETSESTELVVISELKSALIFVPNGSDDVLKNIEDRARSLVLDISTPDGRKEVASVAYQIARTKTALDKMGKDLTEDLRKKKDAVDEERRKIRDRLDALKDEIRKPLTEFEEKEKSRVAAHELVLQEISNSRVFQDEYGRPYDADQTGLRDRIERVKALAEREWQEFQQKADGDVAHTLGWLETKLALRIEQDRKEAELARLRAEEEARKQREREEQIAKEAAERAKREAEEKAERERVEAEAKAKAEIERVERAKREAEDRARKAEDARIAAEKKAEADKTAAAEKAKKDAEAAAQAERDRQSAEKKSEADATAKREADKKHKAKIHNEVKDALQSIIESGNLGDDPMKDIVVAIATGKIPHVKITY